MATSQNEPLLSFGGYAGLLQLPLRQTSICKEGSRVLLKHLPAQQCLILTGPHAGVSLLTPVRGLGKRRKWKVTSMAIRYSALRKRMVRRRDTVARKLAAVDGSMKVTLYTAHFDAKRDALYLIRNTILAGQFYRYQCPATFHGAYPFQRRRLNGIPDRAHPVKLFTTFPPAPPALSLGLQDIQIPRHGL